MNINITLTDSQAAALQYVLDKANAAATTANPQAPQLTPEQYLQARVDSLCESYDAERVEDVRSENSALIEAVLAAPLDVRNQAKAYLQNLLAAQPQA